MLRIAEEALTFDDVLLLPAHSTVLPKTVSLESRLTASIALNIPLVSSAMDTVTEARLAIAMAQEGGIGVIHKSMTVEKQAREVRLVKKFESGVVKDPITIAASATIGELIALIKENNISGMPVLDGNDLVGIVTSRDVRFEANYALPVSSIMTTKERLVTVREDFDLAEVKELLHRHRIEKLLVVNEAFELRGLITLKDIRKSEDYPNACKDEYGRLRVAAAVGTGPDTADRVDAIVEAGVDVVYVSNHGGRQLDHSRACIDSLPEVVEAVQGRVPVIVDGGFMRGADVVKGLCLGADIVGMGRFEGLCMAAGGKDALVRGLTILEQEIRITMALAGAATLADLNPSLVERLEPVGTPSVLSSFPLLSEIE